MLKIHEFASKGDCKGVENEIRTGVSVDIRDESKGTPLSCAASSPDAGMEMMHLLIGAGADVNAAVGERERSPLVLAACSGSLEKVQMLLAAGADVKAKSAYGYTVLLHAIHALHRDEKLVPICELLARNGADLDSASDYDESPLSVALGIGRFDVIRCLLDAGVNPQPLHWTELMKAVALGTGDDVQRLLHEGHGLDECDRWDRTPWHLACMAADVEKAKLLRTAGADINAQDRFDRTALMDCASRGDAEMLQWLIEIGAKIEAVDFTGSSALIIAAQAGSAACVERLLAAGASPSRTTKYEENAMELAANEAVMRLLLRAGEDICDISTELKRALTGLQGDEVLNISQAEYESGKGPRPGRSNPQAMTIPFWHEMVRTGITAYQTKQQFDDAGNMEPVWCFNRFGTSFTELPDGRFVQIAGEHEDHYDVDFCIYQDVFVHERSGKFQIFGYPTQVFPPIDFHSATYVNGFIYIIGGLGYHGARQFGSTPIFRLDCGTWRVDTVLSSGENPGWLYEHKAILINAERIVVSGGKVCVEIDGEEQHIENHDQFSLNLSNMKWTRLSQAQRS